jgi:hypothetical protein
MVHTVDKNDLVVFEDLVDDAVVATPRRPQTLEFTSERLSEPVRVLSDRSEDRLQRSPAHFVRESFERTETLTCDLDLVHSATSDVVPERHTLGLLSVAARPPKRLHEPVVSEDVESFLEGLEVVGTHQNERGSPIPRDQDTVVLAFHPVGQFR